MHYDFAKVFSYLKIAQINQPQTDRRIIVDKKHQEQNHKTHFNVLKL